MSKTFREISKPDRVSNEPLTTTDIQIGCLQRITDAIEKIAQNSEKILQNYEILLDENTRLKKHNQDLLVSLKYQRNSIAGHKAAYTKLKNKMEAKDGKKTL